MTLEDLIAPVTKKELFEEILGKKPYVFPATDYKKEFFSN